MNVGSISSNKLASTSIGEKVNTEASAFLPCTLKATDQSWLDMNRVVMVYKSFPVVSFHPYRGIHSKDNANAQNDGT